MLVSIGFGGVFCLECFIEFIVVFLFFVVYKVKVISEFVEVLIDIEFCVVLIQKCFVFFVVFLVKVIFFFNDVDFVSVIIDVMVIICKLDLKNDDMIF